MNHRHVLLLVFFALVRVSGQPLKSPLFGWIRDAGQWRAIHGIAGNFLTEAPLRDGVVAGGFSGTAGAIKTDSEIITFDGEGQTTGRWAAPAGPGLFAFDRAGHPAWCYLSGPKQLVDLRKSDAGARDLSATPGTVLAVGMAGDTLRFLIVRDGALWLGQDSSGDQLLPGLPASGPALLLNDGTVVVADGEALIIRSEDSGDQRLTLPAPAQELEQLGEQWIRVGQPDGAPPLALRLSREGASVYRLPAVEAQQP